MMPNTQREEQTEPALVTQCASCEVLSLEYKRISEKALLEVLGDRRDGGAK
jgi:hypothetical protein